MQTVKHYSELGNDPVTVMNKWYLIKRLSWQADIPPAELFFGGFSAAVKNTADTANGDGWGVWLEFHTSFGFPVPFLHQEPIWNKWTDSQTGATYIVAY